jgi:hypothetical protein
MNVTHTVSDSRPPHLEGQVPVFITPGSGLRVAPRTRKATIVLEVLEPASMRSSLISWS